MKEAEQLQIIQDNLSPDIDAVPAWAKSEGWGLPTENEDNDPWAAPAVVDWEPAVKPSFFPFLGPTAFPLTHTSGIVECSVRRIKSFTEPPALNTIPKSAVTSEPDADAVEVELEKRFAKVVLSPWAGWDDYSDEAPHMAKPRILETSVGPINGVLGEDGKVEPFPTTGQPTAGTSEPTETSAPALAEGPKPHDPFNDEITLLVEPALLPLLSTGMGLGATWVQIARQQDLGGEEKTKKKKKGKKVVGSFLYGHFEGNNSHIHGTIQVLRNIAIRPLKTRFIRHKAMGTLTYASYHHDYSPLTRSSTSPGAMVTSVLPARVLPTLATTPSARFNPVSDYYGAFPPLPPVSPAPTSIPFEEVFKHHGIKMFDEGLERHASGAQLTWTWRADAVSISNTNIVTQPRRRWWDIWMEDEETMIVGPYDMNTPAIDRLYRAAHDFRNSRVWLRAPRGLPTLWDQFCFFIDISPNSWTRTEAESILLTTENFLDSQQASQDDHSNEFLNDPELKIEIFLSTYIYKQGLIQYGFPIVVFMGYITDPVA
ncbi:hypothetical protein H0H93_009465 [Arthromyces matolae]|nr:hypothetical protein H0H93_009465 [Arthromyces matolae]